MFTLDKITFKILSVNGCSAEFAMAILAWSGGVL
jgi:hypothetical protein